MIGSRSEMSFLRSTAAQSLRDPAVSLSFDFDPLCFRLWFGLDEISQELDREVVWRHHAGAVHEPKLTVLDRQGDCRLFDDAAAEGGATRAD